MVFVVQLIWRTFSILMGDHGFIFFSLSLSLVILGYFLPVFACKNWSDLTPQSRAFSPSFYLNPQIRCDQMLNLLNSVERQKSDYSMQYLMPDQGEREREKQNGFDLSISTQAPHSGRNWEYEKVCIRLPGSIFQPFILRWVRQTSVTN